MSNFPNNFIWYRSLHYVANSCFSVKSYFWVARFILLLMFIIYIIIIIPGTHPAPCKMGTGPFPGLLCGRGVLLATHPLLVPR